MWSSYQTRNWQQTDRITNTCDQQALTKQRVSRTDSREFSARIASLRINRQVEHLFPTQSRSRLDHNDYARSHVPNPITDFASVSYQYTNLRLLHTYTLYKWKDSSSSITFAALERSTIAQIEAPVQVAPKRLIVPEFGASNK